jgi:microcystin-dependent protein
MTTYAANQTSHYGFREPIITADDTTWADDYPSGDPAVDPSPGLNGNWSKMDILLQMQRDKIAELQAVIDGLPDNIDGLRIQIGGIYATLDATNPGTKLGYGVWEPWGMGRALVSEGQTDRTWTIEQEDGSETHTLSWNEMGVHDHWADPPNTNTSSNGAHAHSYTTRGGNVNSDQESGTQGISDGTKTTNTQGNHAHTFDVPNMTSGSKGGGAAHNNIMPSKAAFLWKRTA